MESRPVLPVEPGDIQRQLAGVLLQYAGIDKARRPGLSQREMAVILDTSWDMVDTSLKSMQAEGAIRIERHRMILNKEALERLAADTGKTGFAGKNSDTERVQKADNLDGEIDNFRKWTGNRKLPD